MAGWLSSMRAGVDIARTLLLTTKRHGSQENLEFVFR